MPGLLCNSIRVIVIVSALQHFSTVLLNIVVVCSVVVPKVCLCATVLTFSLNGSVVVLLLLVFCLLVCN